MTRIEEIKARLAKATPGPWAYASVGEKENLLSVGANVFAEDDEDCKTPLSGNLSDREDNYFVEESVAAEVTSHSNAALIANAPSDLQFLLDQLDAAQKNVRVAGYREGWLDGHSAGETDGELSGRERRESADAAAAHYRECLPSSSQPGEGL